MEANVAIGLVLTFFALSWLCMRSERREWNDGICRENGQRWRIFDVDSQGGRGYKAGEGETQRVCWISWPGVDRNRIPGLSSQ